MLFLAVVVGVVECFPTAIRKLDGKLATQTRDVPEATFRRVFI